MKNIVIYTGPFCNYCDAAKRLLVRNNANFKEIDIGKVDGAIDEMIKRIVLKNRELKMAKKDYLVEYSIFEKKCIIIFFQI